MNRPEDYIGHEEYLDVPLIYGRHRTYWNSLSFLEKVDTIRHVGLFSFLREVLGFADAERIRKRLETKCGTLSSEHEAMQERITTLEQEKRELEQKLEKVTKKLNEAERASYGRSHRLLTPPSTRDIVNAFNRSSVDRAHPWFFNAYEDPCTGTITLRHDFAFYPIPSIIVPRGKLRLCDRYGMVVNLAQCAEYAALPAKYAQHLVPQGFHAHRLRVLFVTRDRDFWLADPCSAQDIILEIRARYDEGRDCASYDASVKSWKERYYENHATNCGYYGEPIFELVVSIEELLSRGQNNFSKEQIKRIRDKCYAEYLDIYFGNDKHDED